MRRGAGVILAPGLTEAPGIPEGTHGAPRREPTSPKSAARPAWQPPERSYSGRDEGLAEPPSPLPTMLQSPLLPLHESAGARLVPRPQAPDSLTPLTFGDVPAEYRAAREGCALFDETDRGAVRVTGADAAAFLHRITANQVRDLPVGTCSENLLLSAKGKVLHVFGQYVVEGGLDLSTEPGGAAALLAALDMYLFTEDVKLEDATEETAPLALVGPKAREVLEGVLGPIPDDLARSEDRFLQVSWDAGRLFVHAASVAGVPGYRLDAGSAGDARALWEELTVRGATPAGLVVRDMLRVEAGRAEPGVDVTDDVYPQEARLESAFSLDKGCYIGQEVVAKIDTYGGLNKRLETLRVSHDDPVPAGTELVVEEDGEMRRLGVVTSWAYSFELDTGLVLAYVKRKHQEPGTTFRLGESDATAVIVETPVKV